VHRTAAIAVLFGAFLAGRAAAQSADWNFCGPAAPEDWDRAIAACSRLAATGSLKAAERAAVHVNRGTAYLRKGDSDRALRDFDAALKIDPGDVVALNRRGEAHSAKADFTRALADYSEAVRLNPRYPLAFRNRARLYFYRGDFAAAAEDFRFAEQADPGNGYSLLWRYVAEARSGVVDRAGLFKGAALVRDGWPKPLVLHFLGNIGEAEMLAAVGAAQAQRQEQECEAHFFLGQKHVLDGENDAAAASLKRALALCPRHMVEHHATRVDLQRLGVAP
jgi:lipoprotein NlpI